METRPPILLDTTLRDGSYVVDFGFQPDDTARIVSALDRAGVPYIEIGHGLGLGAYATHGANTASDTEHIAAAVSVRRSAKLGVFYLPEIGTPDDIQRAAAQGIDFVRIGTEVREVAGAVRAIDAAKAFGLQAFVNLLKTYAVPASELGQYAATAERLGAEGLYIVDSAGGMTPREVETYVRVASAACALPIGFHGHDNLSLAVANTLAAQDAGAIFLDGTLAGMGRSEGNAATEILGALFQREGHWKQLDVDALLEASEALVQPFLDRATRSGIGIASGIARFHSSRLGSVLAAAQRYRVNPRAVIQSLSEYDVVNPSQDLIECIARDLAHATRSEESIRRDA